MNKYLYEIISNSGDLSLEDIIIRICVSVFFGIIIFLSYRLTHNGAIYSRKFNITLVTLTVLTTMVMTVIGNNVALSLGMVGALSIVRFRTSIKDSRDTAYIFWTIIIGICCGVGDYTVAAIGSILVFLILFIMGRVKNEYRTLLIIRGKRRKENEIRRFVFESMTKTPVLKAENTTEDTVEFIYEIDRRALMKFEDTEREEAAKDDREAESFTDKLYKLGDIEYVNIVVQSDEIS